MMILRLSKVACVAAIALFASLVAFGNITDYGTNWAFVQHVMRMDTVFPNSTIRYRAIDNTTLQTVAYAAIIAAETLTAILCWIGAAKLLAAAGGDARGFSTGQDLCHSRSDLRLPGLAGRLPVDWRRMLRHVDVDDMEWRGLCLPGLNHHTCRVDLRYAAGAGPRLSAAMRWPVIETCQMPGLPVTATGVRPVSAA
jgi:Predicted small integral membrane protein (DUF2165)